ncbi:hypothetical protein [Pseudomonas folii]|uniref:DUF4398 domain-containing protein n=1 Tax=Pseudomonas folii TaxID=2762593 RepID=A0ABR7B4C4_9PSED|nr:hypothetical protein [Pseudomonas folii]MBC3952036.1 hypothetical protein [Pseudomonas folii]
MKAAITLMLCATLILAGCTIPWRSTLTLQAEDRIVTGIERPTVIDGVAYNQRIICAEPSPDALKAIAASGSLSKSDILAISGAYQEAGANIGLRTQSIQLLRDQLYTLCQAYANGVINQATYMMYLTRNQRNTVAILAIEQLTGVTKGSIATVTGTSSVTLTAQDVQTQTKLLEAAKSQLKTLDASSAQAKELQKLIEEQQAKLDKAKVGIISAVATGAATNSSQGTQPDSASVAKIADVVWAIADSVTSINDFYYLCLNAYSSDPERMPASLKKSCDIALENLGNATGTVPPKPKQHSPKAGSAPKKTTEPNSPPTQTGPVLQQTPPMKNDI